MGHALSKRQLALCHLKLATSRSHSASALSDPQSLFWCGMHRSGGSR
jgi:hypothetical protein